MLVRLVTNAPTPTTVDIVNGTLITAYRLLKQSASGGVLSWGNDAWEHQFSGARGTQGAAPAPGSPQNRVVNLPVRVYGTTKDDLAQQHVTLKAAVDEMRRFGGRILFQSNSQTRRQWFRVLVCGTTETDWSRAETKNIAELAVQAICAPYLEGDPMDYTDDFSTDTITAGNYTFDAGSGNGVGTHPWTPTVIAGCEIWCRPETLGANGSAVSSWTNEGSGAALAQATGANQPTVVTNQLNGDSIVRFDGTNDFLAAALAADASRTVFIVAKHNAARVTDDWLLEFGAANAIVRSSNSGPWTYNRNQALADVQIAASSTVWELIELKFTSTSVMDTWLNGGNRVTLDPDDSYSTQTALNVGASPAGANAFAGDVAEVIVYDSPLSDADRQSVEGYLSNKYPTLGAFGTPPAAVPNVADVVVSGGQLTPAVGTLALTAERRAYFSAYGYTFGDHQVQLKATPGATITSYKAGAVIKRIDATNYLEAYVDDNGVNSRLRIDKIVAAARTNLATTNLAARVINATAFWLRGRIEGNTVYAEYNTAAPMPQDAGTSAINYALAAGAEQNTFGSSIVGRAGFSWIPQAAGAVIDDLVIQPYTYKGAILPRTIQLMGAIPGDSPAPVSATFAPTGVVTARRFGFLGWASRPIAPVAGAVAPFGLIEAEASTSTALAVTADANGHGGNVLQTTSTVGGSFISEFQIDPSTLVPDDYAGGDVLIEFWARLKLIDTLNAPTLVFFSTHPSDAGLSAYTEYGSTPRNVVKPSVGTVYRLTRLGILRFRVDRANRQKVKITLTLGLTAGGSGAYGFDYILPVLAQHRICSPTAKPSGSSYPTFIPGVSATSTKTVQPDLSGLAWDRGIAPVPHSGLGGSTLLEFPPGNVDVLAHCSNWIPDDTTASVALDYDVTDTLALHFAVTPRYRLLRAS